MQEGIPDESIQHASPTVNVVDPITISANPRNVRQLPFASLKTISLEEVANIWKVSTAKNHPGRQNIDIHSHNFAPVYEMDLELVRLGLSCLMSRSCSSMPNLVAVSINLSRSIFLSFQCF